MSQLTQVFASAGDWEEFVESDREFHLSVLDAVENEKLLEIIGTLRDQSRLTGLEQLAGTSVVQDSTKEHELLLDAMRTQDPEKAAELMTNHLRHVRGTWAGQKGQLGKFLAKAKRPP